MGTDIKKKILVLGLGNIILSDEGVGIHAVEMFGRNNPYDCVETLDGGTGGLAILGILQSYEHVIMADAALDNFPPGTVRRITPRYSHDYPVLMSAHEIGIKEMVDAMHLLGNVPHIELVVMSVRNIRKIGMGLSAEAENGLLRMLDAIHGIISEIGINAVPERRAD